MRISYQEAPTDIQGLDEVDRWRASQGPADAGGGRCGLQQDAYGL
jgi:hypothetical protein